LPRPVAYEIKVSRAPVTPMNIPNMKILLIDVAKPTPDRNEVYPRWPTAIMSIV